MKKRNFNPELFSDDKLGECGVYALPLYLGLLCQSDSDGKLEDRPAKIKVKIFPYFDLDINLELNKLASCGFIDRYEVDGIKVIKIINFENLGITYNNEKASGLPEKPATDQLVPSCIEADNQLNNININNNIKLNINKNSITKERSKTTVEPEAEDYILDDKTNRKKKTSVLVLPEKLPDNLEQVRPQLLLWLQWKQERRQGYQKLGLEALLKRLANCSPRAIMDAIEQSMSNGWTGLFPEKLDKPSGGLFNSAIQTQNMIDKVIQEEEAKYHG